MRPSAPLAAALAAGAALLAGCGPPPERPESPEVPTPAASRTSPGPTFPSPGAPGAPGSPGVPGGPGSPGTGAEIAVPCNGEPDADAVLALLRAEQVLGDGAEAEVADGPLCAGGWQYAVVSVPERDPLQVVTRGDPDELELVTAGTDVCTPEVRIQAPPGIRSTAACVG